ncbi:MAG TPA: aldose epimerase family protein [Flavisolibacter sp.]|nr:aldose epimerase family protein [Flavisolibacter sp.]
MALDRNLFRTHVGGNSTDLHHLSGSDGIEIAITNYGARIAAILVNDNKGQQVDVVTGFASIREYLDSSEPYHGAIVGRYANRIAGGRFTLHGKTYQLPLNTPPNHLHGGPNGFHCRVWTFESVSKKEISLSYFSKDGEEGYPGNLSVKVKYALAGRELSIEYEATTDQPTILNLTSHPFFNLNGQGNGTILQHVLQVHADRYNPINEDMIPEGIDTVEGGPFDFRKPREIGERIDNGSIQLKNGSGYDHNFIVPGSGMRPAAKITGDLTAIEMEVLTDQPSIQFYSGNFMKGDNTIKYGLKDIYRGAFCLETQHYPDSPNHPEFPSTVLDPHSVFRSKTVYRFPSN